MSGVPEVRGVRHEREHRMVEQCAAIDILSGLEGVEQSRGFGVVPGMYVRQKLGERPLFIVLRLRPDDRVAAIGVAIRVMFQLLPRVVRVKIVECHVAGGRGPLERRHTEEVALKRGANDAHV